MKYLHVVVQLIFLLNFSVYLYDNFIKEGAKSVSIKKGRYVVLAPFNENTIIKMIINFSGKITTAYPILK